MPPRTKTVPSASGSLGKTPLAHLLVYMMDRKLDGSIVFTGGDGAEHIVVFTQGSPGKARVGFAVSHLGRVLLELGLLDIDSLNHSLEELARRGGLHGEILLSLGLIDRAKLTAGLREQLLRRLVRLFECLGDETSYAFYKSANLLDDWGGNELTPIDPLVALWAGVRARPSSPHVEPTLARVGISPLRISAQADLRRFQFAEPERAFLEYVCARPVSVSEMLASRILPERQMKVLIYLLLISHQLDIVRPVEHPAPVAAHQAEPPPPSSKPSAARVTSSSQMPVVNSPSVTSSAKMAAVPPSSRSGAASSQIGPAHTPARASEPKLTGQNVASTLRNRTSQPDPRASSPASPAVKSPMFAAERQAIIDRAEAIGKEDYFTILGVSQEAPFDVVQSAYFSLAKKWHPDRLPPELADLREHAAKIFARMSEASQTLTDPDKRKKYIDNRTQGLVSADEQQVVNRIVEAAFDFQKADILLKKRDYSGAEALSRKAFDADPEQADYLAVLAWCIAQQPARLKDKNFVESLDMLNKAIKLQEKCERAYFYRGSLLALMGKGDAAARDFRRSVELNPRNVEAVRQLRLFEMRGAGASAAPPSANAEPKETASDSAPINWTQDGVGTILGKLFKK